MKRPKSKFVLMKKCPFCSSAKAAIRGSFDDDEVCWVSCNKCHADGPYKKTRTLAIKAWNNAT